MTDLPDKRPDSEILIYQTEDGRTRIQVRLEDETVWLTQKMMAELFQKDVRTINEHIRNIFKEGELTPKPVIRKFRITAADGKTYETNYYNLDVIISVGYRVKSHRGTQFRIWATQRLREYIIKGFALDDERLKEAGGGNYFDELLDRIRDIRSSEKVFWRLATPPSRYQASGASEIRRVAACESPPELPQRIADPPDRSGHHTGWQDC